MSNPYEKILQSRPPAKPSKPAREVRPSHSTVLSRASKKKPAEKPPIRFNVRPRFRFDLPDPPMDPKMLLGRISTADYARPFVSQLEKEFRPQAIPADPTYGLRPNLVESALYSRGVDLTVDDDALLLSVMAGRTGHTTPKVADVSRRGAQNCCILPSASKPAPICSAPWMLRMSYDEYRGGSTSMGRHKLTAREEVEASDKLANRRKHDPKMREKRRRVMLQSFAALEKLPIHPDKHRARLRPVSITPVVPDLYHLTNKFVVLEFDKDDILTTAERVERGGIIADEAVRTAATLVVGQESRVKKTVACYTPVDGTLEKRKRQRDSEGDEEMGKKSKKINFAKEEVYERLSEYSAPVGLYGSQAGHRAPSRSCYAISEYVQKNSMSRIALLSKVETGWQLAKRPGTEQKTGEKYIALRRDSHNRDTDSRVRDLIAGSDLKTKGEPEMEPKMESKMETKREY